MAASNNHRLTVTVKPNSGHTLFRYTAKDIAGGALDNSMTLNNNTSGMNNVTQWGWNAIQNAYQKTSSAISRGVRRS